jgi:hypothetical protein
LKSEYRFVDGGSILGTTNFEPAPLLARALAAASSAKIEVDTVNCHIKHSSVSSNNLLALDRSIVKCRDSLISRISLESNRETISWSKRIDASKAIHD